MSATIAMGITIICRDCGAELNTVQSATTPDTDGGVTFNVEPCGCWACQMAFNVGWSTLDMFKGRDAQFRYTRKDGKFRVLEGELMSQEENLTNGTRYITIWDTEDDHPKVLLFDRLEEIVDSHTDQLYKVIH